MTSDGGTWRLAAVQLPTGGIYTNTFNGSDQIGAMSDPRANTSSLTWDGYNLTQVQDALGNKTTLGYMPYGQVQAVTNPLNQTRTLVYDGANGGLLTAAVDPLGNRTSFSHNPAGMTATVENPLGQIASLVWDDDNRPLVTTNSLGNSTTNTYTSGLLTQVTNALGYTTSLGYDGSAGCRPPPMPWDM